MQRWNHLIILIFSGYFLVGCYLNANIAGLAESSTVNQEDNSGEKLSLDSCLNSVSKNNNYSCFSKPTTVEASEYKLSSENTCDFISIDPNSGTISGTPSLLDIGACILSVEVNSGGKILKGTKEVVISDSSFSFSSGVMPGFSTMQYVREIKTSPDDQWLVYRTENQYAKYTLNSIKVDGTGFSRLSLVNDSVGYYSISDDSTKVYYISALNQQLYVMDITGSNVKKLSSDSEKVHFYSEVPNTSDLVYFDSVGKQLYKLPKLGGAKLPLLNTPVAIYFFNGISKFEVINSSYLVFPADQIFSRSIYSVPLDGSGEIILHPAPPVFGGFSNYMISNDKQKVIIVGDFEVDEKYELYSANIDGSAKTKISPVLGASSDVREVIAISPDSTKVAFAANYTSTSNNDLYLVNISGGGLTKLTPTLTAGQNVSPGSASSCNQERKYGCQIVFTNDSSKVIYNSDQRINNVDEIFAVNADGTGNIRISGNIVAGGNAFGFLLDSTSSRIVFNGDMETDNLYELYSAAIDGSGVVKISAVSGANVYWALNVNYFSPLSSKLLTELKENTTQGSKTLVIDLVTGVRTELSFGNGEGLSSAAYSGNKQKLYIARQTKGVTQFYRYDFNDSSYTKFFDVPVDIVDENYVYMTSLMAGKNYLVTKDFNQIFYNSNSTVDYSYTIQKLIIPSNSFSSILFPASAKLVGLNSNETKFVLTDLDFLMTQNVDGSGSPQGINSISSGSGIEKNQILSNDDVVYMNEEVSFTSELFKSSLNGGAAVRINAPIASSSKEVKLFEVSKNEQKLVYTSSEDNLLSLRSCNVNGSDKVVLAVNNTGGVYVPSTNAKMAISPNSQLVAFVSEQGSVAPQLYVSNLSGAGGLQLAGDLSAPVGKSMDFKWMPNSQKLVVLSYLSDANKNELFLTNASAGGVHTKISRALVANGNVIDFVISDDGQYVGYIADAEEDEKYEAYISKLSDSSTIKIAGPIITGGNVIKGGLIFDPLSRYAIFKAYKNSLSRLELFSYNLVKNKLITLSGAMQDGARVAKYQATSNGRLYYISDEHKSGVNSFYSVTLNGTGRVKLDSLSSYGDGVANFKINSTGDTGVFIIYDSTTTTMKAIKFSY